ncbi:hypothetical protein [Halomonas litopenaei]|uniref:hypothetical protein n=1 Tax=Halomonas litopenaei TaxID=2109328 RepID=UPI003FA05821
MTASNEVESLWERLEQVEAERGALAAHVERLTRYSKEARLCLDHARVFISTRQKMHECGREAHDECLACLTQSLEDTPATSLARRDARVKAEALEALSQQLSLNAENARENHYHWSADAMQDASDEALQEAAKCRQQAEGGGDE